MIWKYNWDVILTLAKRTFRQSVESPIAYIVAILFYGFVGALFGLNFFLNNQASITGVALVAPWILWFVVPGMTMGYISDELRSGTFEQLATLPIREGEIVLGKYLGFVLLALVLTLGLGLFPVLVAFSTDHPQGLDWGAGLGILGAMFFLMLFYGAMGLWASSLARNQVVALILGMILCTFFFFVGQFYFVFPGFLSQFAEFLGVGSHLQTLSRGVWDFRDLFYFGSFVSLFLYLTTLRLSTRRV